ncbi:MAG: IMPACT family protein [Chitinophagales bacterium]|nr:IMPACT family protein [Chitinophagales bacterium]
MHTYFSITHPAEAYFEDKGSKFLAFAYAVANENEIKNALVEIKEKHPKATHHCYAYRLGFDKNNYRANDDGEPSGSAGRPILGQIDSFGLSNVLIIVVRYYGGTKLGVSGLINAYKHATKNALEQAEIIEKDIEQEIEIHCNYLQVNDVFNFLKKNNINEWHDSYTDFCKIKCTIPISKIESVSLWLEENDIEFLEIK